MNHRFVYAFATALTLGVASFPISAMAASFDDAWKSVANGAEKTAQAGDWVIERGKEGVVAVRRTTDKAGSSAKEAVDDAAIYTAIEGRLAADPETSIRTTRIHVKDGVVTLRGHVRDAEAAATAIRLASETKGVNSVISQLSWPGMNAPQR